MTFYEYHQNNSGGYFRGPAKWLLVEADKASAADMIASGAGVYFDPECQIDCPCCGSRWSRAWEDIGTANRPEVYGKEVTEGGDASDINRGGLWKRNDPIVLIIRADGRREAFDIVDDTWVQRLDAPEGAHP